MEFKGENIVEQSTLGMISANRLFLYVKNKNIKEISFENIENMTLIRKNNIFMTVLYAVAAGMIYNAVIINQYPVFSSIIRMMLVIIAVLAGIYYLMGYHVIRFKTKSGIITSNKIELSKLKEGKLFFSMIARHVSNPTTNAHISQV